MIDIVARVTVDGVRRVRAYEGGTFSLLSIPVNFPGNLDDIEAVNPKPIIRIVAIDQTGDEESGEPLRLAIAREAESWNLGSLDVYLDGKLDPEYAAEKAAAGEQCAVDGVDVVFPRFTFEDGVEVIEVEVPIVDDPWEEDQEWMIVRVTPNINYEVQVMDPREFGITDVGSSDSLSEDLTPGTASIEGRVWIDAHADGKQHGTEFNLADTTVRLWQSGAAQPTATTVTNAAGVFMFTSDARTPYRIEVVNPDEYKYSPVQRRVLANAELDSNIYANGFTEWFSSRSGAADTSHDAGFAMLDTPAYAYDREFTMLHDTVLVGMVDYIDDEGHDVTFVLTQDTSSGDLDFNTQSGGFTFTPAAHFEGDVTFQYSVFDGYYDGKAKTVTIHVTNADPFGGGETFSVTHDQTLSGYGLFLNDSDFDNDALFASKYSQPANGTISNFNTIQGTFDYTPNAAFVGEDRFTYSVSDGVDEVVVPVVITVTNHRPLGTTGGYYAHEGLPIVETVPMSDSDNDNLEAVLVTAPSQGSFSFLPNGHFTYYPDYPLNSFAFSPDSFTYRVSDGISSSQVATALLTTHEYDERRIRAVGIAQQFRHDTLIQSTVDLAGMIYYPSDPPPLIIVVDSPPSHGTLTNWDGISFTYTPDAGYVGTDVFWYHAVQGEYVGESGPAFLTAVNGAPVARGETFNISQFGGTLTVDAIQGVLGNDDDVDYDTMQAVLVAEPDDGELSLLPDGSFAFTYPDEFSGIVEFSYLTTDGLLSSEPATVLINVFAEEIKGKIDIADGLSYDGVGGNWVPDADKGVKGKGAVTVANLNDTDNDGTPDKDDNDVSPQPMSEGRIEGDLMPIRLHKPTGTMPDGFKVRAIITIGNVNAKLWKNHVGPNNNTSNPQSKKSGLAAESYTLGDFDAAGQILIFLEATALTGYRGIVVEYQYQLPGQNTWTLLDKVAATGVWLTMSNFWDPAGARLNVMPVNMIGNEIVSLVTESTAVDGSTVGHGSYKSDLLKPNPKDTGYGGRILYECPVTPIEVAGQVVFDITRRYLGTVRYYTTAAAQWTDQSVIPTFPKNNESSNDDLDTGDEQNDPEAMRINKDAGGKLYSFDGPSHDWGNLTQTYDFKVYRANFEEYVRAGVKTRNQLTPIVIVGGPGTNGLGGSRVSAFTSWHHSHALVWDGSAMVPDALKASVSNPRRTGAGNGTMQVTLGQAPITLGITATFNGANWIVTIAGPTIAATTKTIAGHSGSVTFNDANMASICKVAITQGNVAFANNDKFTSSIYATGRTAGKVNSTGLNKIQQDPSID